MSRKPLTDRETPLRLVRTLARELPGAYDALDRLSQSWREMPDYDPRCSLPISAAYTWMVTELKATDLQAAQLAGEITACYLWRKTPVIYDYDPDLAAMLYAQADETDDTQPLPWEVLLRLPYPCVYIRAPGMRAGIDGFFVFIELDLNSHTLELRMQAVADDMDGTMPFSLHLLPGATLADCLEDTRRVTRLNFRDYASADDVPEDVREAVMADWTALMLRPLQLTLYLCAANAEIEPRQEPRVVRPRPSGQGPRRPAERKASDVAAYNVGVRLGASIRRAAARPAAVPQTEPGSGTPKRPHSRRGHWHHYWLGPRSGERALTLKWIAPTYIHADDPGPAPVVQIPVK